MTSNMDSCQERALQMKWLLFTAQSRPKGVALYVCGVRRCAWQDAKS